MNRWSSFAALLLVSSHACAPVDTGSGSVGPGSDGGPVFTGGGGGGAPDAGAPGGGADAGSPDAGPGGTADAGSTGGGTADAGSAGGGVANGCDGLLPASIPAPSTAIVPHKAGQSCFYFSLDQMGDVAGESHSGGDPATTLLNTQWQTWSAGGAPGRQFSAGYDLYGEPDGFEGASRDAASTSIVKWSSTGAEQRRTLLSGPTCSARAFLSRFAGTLALGGCDGGGLTAALFDAQGAAILSRVIASKKVDAVGVVDAQGRTVVVLPGSAVGLSSTYAARWFDNQLAPLTDWFTLPGSGVNPSLQPLIGGGAAYQVGGDWVASLGSGTPGWTAPPAFLAGHPKNDFRAIRGGRGYARIARYGADEPGNKIEIYDLAGDHCGTGTFPGEGVAVGQDGTVIATGGDGGCSLSWWTGILR